MAVKLLRGAKAAKQHATTVRNLPPGTVEPAAHLKARSEMGLVPSAIFLRSAGPLGSSLRHTQQPTLQSQSIACARSCNVVAS